MSHWWPVLAGTVCILLALREVFHDLFHPTVSGSLSDYVGRSIFGLFRRRPSLLPHAGPLSLVIVILSWAFLIAAGFALIYWPSMPAGFHLNTGRGPDAERGFAPALYFSMEALTTLGLGDFAPTVGWIRFLASLEALLGLALFTASVTWIVLLFPALGRMRSLARRTSVLAEAGKKAGVDIISADAEGLLLGLAVDLIRARVDLVHFPILYYFYPEDKKAALSHAISHLVRFAEASSLAGCTERVRLASAALRVALDDLADLLADKFIDADPKDPAAVFRGYADAHKRTGE